jgi:predicted deacylase
MPYYGDVDDYLATLVRIAELKPAVLVTPHFGLIAHDGIAAALNRCRRFVAELDRAVLSVLHRLARPLQLKDIVAELHRDTPTWTLAYQLHATTQAHLHHLVRRGEVRAEAHDEAIHWSLAR